MKRLTERDEYGNADVIGVDFTEYVNSLAPEGFVKIINAFNRLAAYEDTGLTPKEVKVLIAKETAKADGGNNG